jgi:DNA-directed RNA polymerase specialized sigma24 family protein
MDKIFITNYESLHTYAENLLYRMPWLLGKGYTAKDVVHEAYLTYSQYKHKFENYDENKLLQVIKNIVYWAVKGINRKNKESLTEDFVIEDLGNIPEVEDRIFNRELSGAVKDLGKPAEDILNLRLSGYSYREINDMRNMQNSKVVINAYMAKLGNMLGICCDKSSVNSRLLEYVQERLSITEMCRRTGLTHHIIRNNLKGLLGPEYDGYAKETQKKKRRT